MDEKESNITSKIELCCRLIVGVLFLFSGFAKAIEAGAFTNLLAQYGFLPSIWVAPIIIVTEIAAGASLMLRIYPRQISILSMVMIVIFSLAFLYALITRNITNCGCFGSLKMLELSPVATFIRNVLLLGLLFAIWKFSNRRERVIWQKFAAATVILLVASFLCGSSFATKLEYRKRHPMFERVVSETELPEFMHIVPDSTYLVFILSYRCQSCWNYFDNIKRYQDSGMFDHIAVFIGGEDSLQIFHDYFQPAFPLHEMEERELTRIAGTAPTMYYIQNDTIKYVIEGNVPTFYIFKKNYLTN